MNERAPCFVVHLLGDKIYCADFAAGAQQMSAISLLNVIELLKMQLERGERIERERSIIRPIDVPAHAKAG